MVLHFHICREGSCLSDEMLCNKSQSMSISMKRLKSWDFASMLGLANMSKAWDPALCFYYFVSLEVKPTKPLIT